MTRQATSDPPQGVDAIQVAVASVLTPPGWYREFSLPVGSTARDAIDHSGWQNDHPAVDLANCAFANFGLRIALDTVLASEDRVEILLHSSVDPKEARRARAGGERDA